MTPTASDFISALQKKGEESDPHPHRPPPGHRTKKPTQDTFDDRDLGKTLNLDFERCRDTDGSGFEPAFDVLEYATVDRARQAKKSLCLQQTSLVKMGTYESPRADERLQDPETITKHKQNTRHYRGFCPATLARTVPLPTSPFSLTALPPCGML
jgi:hypothetical protein